MRATVYDESKNNGIPVELDTHSIHSGVREIKAYTLKFQMLTPPIFDKNKILTTEPTYSIDTRPRQSIPKFIFTRRVDGCYRLKGLRSGGPVLDLAECKVVQEFR